MIHFFLSCDGMCRSNFKNWNMKLRTLSKLALSLGGRKFGSFALWLTFNLTVVAFCIGHHGRPIKAGRNSKHLKLNDYCSL